MGSKEKDRTKQIQDKCQNVLIELLRDEDNKYCVDCDSKGPRWASWNLGVFLCIRCAGIHRNLGVHISKVKSVNLDSWTPEQVVSLQQMGNSRARAVYEANLPDNFRRPQNDSSLESFIRAKYEHKKYIAREWVAPPLPKVNWEKEIDEEIDRQKRKKNKYVDSKSKIQIKPFVEIPQIPKPKSVAPTVAPVVATQNGAQESNVDLLNTTPNDDAFSSFLSGPTPVEVPKTSEEENFFNQPAPTEKEKTQLTKDSILALYGQTPSFNQTPSFTQPQQFQQNFNQFQQNSFVANSQMPRQQPGYNMFGQNQPDTSFFQPAQCFGIQQGQFQAPPRPAQGISVPNPFIQPTPVNLQQQFGNLNLGQQSGNIIPTNVWP